MTAREYFQAARDAALAMRRLSARVAAMRASEGARAARFDGMPRASGASDPMDAVASRIDAEAEARRDTLLYPATGLTPEHEETVYRCDECGEIISYDEGYDPETDLPAYCERCGSRITRIGEPWDE